MNTISLSQLEEAANALYINSKSDKVNKSNLNLKSPRETEVDQSISFQLAQEKLAREYEKKLNDLDKSWREKYQSLVERTSLSSQSMQLSQKASLDAKVKEIKTKYEKKLLKIEDSVLKSQQKNREDLIVTHAALQESRNNLQELQSRFTMREEQYREELSLKDIRLSKLVS